jgi:hypothetical protein
MGELTFFMCSSNVDLPSTPVPRRERLDSGSSTTSEKTDNSDAFREFNLEIQSTLKPAPSGLILKRKMLTTKRETTTSNQKHGSKRTGKQSRYYCDSDLMMNFFKGF